MSESSIRHRIDSLRETQERINAARKIIMDYITHLQNLILTMHNRVPPANLEHKYWYPFNITLQKSLHDMTEQVTTPIYLKILNFGYIADSLSEEFDKYDNEVHRAETAYVKTFFTHYNVDFKESFFDTTEKEKKMVQKIQEKLSLFCVDESEIDVAEAKRIAIKLIN